MLRTRAAALPRLAPRFACAPAALLSRHASHAAPTTDALGRKYPEDLGLQHTFAELTNLADERLGAKILFATDEWFATADNLLKPDDPHFDATTFSAEGKVMDGWESRRRRLAGHDWCVIRLGVPGLIHGFEIDSAHFTGNQAPAVRVFGACIEGDEKDSWLGPPRASLGVQGTCSSAEEIEAASRAVDGVRGGWHELVPLSALRPGYVEGGPTAAPEGQVNASVHRFAVAPSAASRRLTHLRFNLHPDGGVARMRAWGVVSRHFETELSAAAVGPIDLLSALNGGRALGASNRHYGHPRNLLQPGRGENMGSGWETARNPRRPPVLQTDAATGFVDMPGVNDWCVLRLGAVAGAVESLTIDTNFFRGNFPESVTVEACYSPEAATEQLLDATSGSSIEWKELLPRTRVAASTEHIFSSADLLPHGKVSHLRVSIFPDGGIMRVRAIGRAVAPLSDAK
ncbi:hypothetical protein AB1Y20_002903 [Prymnesium parvum]|uniref:Allantoicase domain-containing protein n=1 Tax=Prymnesium parvum TaxID=97485 RepID=A0AB34JAF7_PRYPA